MDLSDVNLKGMELVEYLAISMGDTKNHIQYKNLILDELERQNISVNQFDVEALRLFSIRILDRALPNSEGSL